MQNSRNQRRITKIVERCTSDSERDFAKSPFYQCGAMYSIPTARQRRQLLVRLRTVRVLIFEC